MRKATPAQIAQAKDILSGHGASAHRAPTFAGIALMGLRGAGKSTLGVRLAAHLCCPFIELNRIIEQDYGASIPDLIEMSGLATFRRYERMSRARHRRTRRPSSPPPAASSNPETYALLLRRTHTVWIKARPDEHMGRVMEQGDFAPWRRTARPWPLVAILDARRADYARAQAELDTSGDTAD
jgi:XRE family aerobic/anaerobic benzoate catabolism transcriptional regulator